MGRCGRKRQQRVRARGVEVLHADDAVCRPVSRHDRLCPGRGPPRHIGRGGGGQNSPFPIQGSPRFPPVDLQCTIPIPEKVEYSNHKFLFQIFFFVHSHFSPGLLSRHFVQTSFSNINFIFNINLTVCLDDFFPDGGEGREVPERGVEAGHLSRQADVVGHALHAVQLHLRLRAGLDGEAARTPWPPSFFYLWGRRQKMDQTN